MSMILGLNRHLRGLSTYLTMPKHTRSSEGSVALGGESIGLQRCSAKDSVGSGEALGYLGPATPKATAWELP